MFPPVRTFILHPDRWWSRAGIASVTDGALLDAVHFPLAALLDGSAGAVTRFSTLSAGIEIDLGAEQNLNMVGLFTHNLDPTLRVSVWVDGALLPRTFSVSYPHCWLDLRAFVTAGTVVRLQAFGNSVPISWGEVVVGDADLFNGTIETPFAEQLTARTARSQTESRVLQEMGAGAVGRAVQLKLTLGPDDQSALQDIVTAAREAGEAIVLAPSSRRNSIFMLMPAAVRTYEHAKSYLQATVQLEGVESTAGVV